MCYIPYKYLAATFWYDESTNMIRYGYREPQDYITAIVFLIFIVCFALYRKKKYRETSYYKVTGNTYWKVWWDKGLLG